LKKNEAKERILHKKKSKFGSQNEKKLLPTSFLLLRILFVCSNNNVFVKIYSFVLQVFCCLKPMIRPWSRVFTKKWFSIIYRDMPNPGL